MLVFQIDSYRHTFNIPIIASVHKCQSTPTYYFPNNLFCSHPIFFFVLSLCLFVIFFLVVFVFHFVVLFFLSSSSCSSVSSSSFFLRLPFLHLLNRVPLSFSSYSFFCIFFLFLLFLFFEFLRFVFPFSVSSLADGQAATWNI